MVIKIELAEVELRAMRDQAHECQVSSDACEDENASIANDVYKLAVNAQVVTVDQTSLARARQVITDFMHSVQKALNLVQWGYNWTDQLLVF